MNNYISNKQIISSTTFHFRTSNKFSKLSESLEDNQGKPFQEEDGLDKTQICRLQQFIKKFCLTRSN